MSGRLLIRGAAPLGASPVDVLLDGTRIAEVGARVRADAEVLDASGLVLLPGLVDLHTHLREPGREDAETVETGSAAAALGGFTAVHAMANTTPVADTAEIVEAVAAAAASGPGSSTSGRSVRCPRACAARNWPRSAGMARSRPRRCGCSATTGGACTTPG